MFWNFFRNHDLTDTMIPYVVFYQYNNFRGRITRMIKGSYNHQLFNAVGIPDSVLSSIRVDAGLAVEFFGDDNFQMPLASFQNDVAGLDEYKNKIRSVRISDTTDLKPGLTILTTGQGTVDKSSLGPTYDEGTLVTLTAQPKTGWVFSSWSGNGINGNQNL